MPGCLATNFRDRVVFAPQLVQKPVVGFIPQRRRTLEENRPQQRLTVRPQHVLLITIAVEFGDAFKQRPQEQQPLRRNLRVFPKHGQNGCDVQMAELHDVGHPVVERGGAVVEQRGHFRIDRPQHGPAASNLVRPGAQPIRGRLEKGTKSFKSPAIEILELIQHHNKPIRGHRFEHLGQFSWRPRSGILIFSDAERLHGIVNGRDHPRIPGIGNLNVENPLVSIHCFESFLDECGLANPAASGDFDEEPASAIENVAQRFQLIVPAIKSPGSHSSALRFHKISRNILLR